MIEHMSRGEFFVDKSAVQAEGWTREGHTYAYFGIVPALLRLPILVWPGLRLMDFTTVSCAVASSLAAVAKLTTAALACRLIGTERYRPAIFVFAALMIVFGGSQVQFLRPSIFQESLSWALAIASIFVLMVFRWCIEPAGRRAWHPAAMALVAGLCLLTRVSTAMGLFGACGGLILLTLARAFGTRGRGPGVMAAVILPGAVLAAFMLICGYINYQRWGNPLTFQDYKYYDMITAADPVHEVIRQHGYFSLSRLPFGFCYYFLPIWTYIRPDHLFLFREYQDRMLFTVEFPPATFLLSDPALLFLALLGCRWLWSHRRAGVVDLPAVVLVAGSFALPGVMILAAIALTFRYRMEFYPFLEFLGLFGLAGLADLIPERRRLVVWACGVMLVVSIIFSNLFLLSYKIAPWADSADIQGQGWAAAYVKYFKAGYPAFQGGR